MPDYRAKCLQAKGYDCMICEADQPVVAHHIDGDDSNNDIDNLIPVCRPCHTSIHSGSDGYEEWTEKVDKSALAHEGRAEISHKLDITGGDAIIAYENGPISFEEEFSVDSIEWYQEDGKDVLTIVANDD